MKFLTFFLVVILAVSARAVTRVQFMGLAGTIRVLPQDFSGAYDRDAEYLYEMMNLPSNKRFGGLEKTFITEDRAFRFTCQQRSSLSTECDIFVYSSEYGSLNIVKGAVQYKVKGREAQGYSKFFKTNKKGEFSFVSIDGLLRIEVKPGHFEVFYSGEKTDTKAPVYSPLPGRTLVLVNVVDTLKISHVEDFWDSLNYNMDSKKRFTGMAEALNHLFRSNSTSARIYYLTHGPELVIGKVERTFLKNNNFPPGEYRTYSADSAKAVQLEVLRRLVSQNFPQRVILLSHNGGMDHQIFRELASEFKKVTFFEYLHSIYSPSPLLEFEEGPVENTNNFVTSVELLLDWQQKGLVEPGVNLSLLKTLSSKIMNEKPEIESLDEKAFPNFVNCSHFKWVWSVEKDYSFLVPFRDHVLARCQRVNEN